MSIEETLAVQPAHAKSQHDVTPGLRVRAERRAGADNPSVLSVRLSKQRYDQLSERDARAAIRTSALAREVIAASLGDSNGDRVAAKLEQVLRRTLSPNLLAS